MLKNEKQEVEDITCRKTPHSTVYVMMPEMSKHHDVPPCRIGRYRSLRSTCKKVFPFISTDSEKNMNFLTRIL